MDRLHADLGVGGRAIESASDVRAAIHPASIGSTLFFFLSVDKSSLSPLPHFAHHVVWTVAAMRLSRRCLPFNALVQGCALWQALPSECRSVGVAFSRTRLPAWWWLARLSVQPCGWLVCPRAGRARSLLATSRGADPRRRRQCVKGEPVCSEAAGVLPWLQVAQMG